MSKQPDWLEEAYARDREEKEQFLKDNPDFVPDGDFWDSHSCSAFADASGCCQWCGALLYKSAAYCDAYGCDPDPIYIDDYYDDGDYYG